MLSSDRHRVQSHLHTIELPSASRYADTMVLVQATLGSTAWYLVLWCPSFGRDALGLLARESLHE